MRRWRARSISVPNDPGGGGVVGGRRNHAQQRVLGVADLQDRERGAGRRGRRQRRRRRRRRPRGRRGRPGRLLRREHDQVDATVWRRVARAHRGAIARSTEILRRWHPDPAVVADAVDPALDARRHVEFEPARPIRERRRDRWRAVLGLVEALRTHEGAERRRVCAPRFRDLVQLGGGASGGGGGWRRKMHMGGMRVWGMGVMRVMGVMPMQEKSPVLSWDVLVSSPLNGCRVGILADGRVA